MLNDYDDEQEYDYPLDYNEIDDEDIMYHSDDFNEDDFDDDDYYD